MLHPFHHTQSFPESMELSKLHNPKTVPSKRKQDDLSEEPRRKSTKTGAEGNTLCEMCDKVDFIAYFTTKQNVTVLGPLSHISECLSCPFCRHIASSMRDEPLSHHQMEGACLKLVQRRVPGFEALRESAIERQFQMEVWAYSRSKRQKCITSVEICETLGEPQYPNARMARIPMKKRFEPKLLLQWLRNTEQKAVTPRQQRPGSASDSLRRLIDQKRLRAIDVRSGEIVVLDAQDRYLALSYVWGKYNTLKEHRLIRQSLKQFQRVAWTVDLASEPATIRDAAYLVRELGERYLWIDSLCIDQEDPLDKAEIISQMDAVYSFAYLTIVAADGNDANAGLGKLYNNDEFPERPIGMLSSKSGNLSVLPTRSLYLESAIQKSVWNTRGWTYQERVLSSKTVFFTEQEVFLSAMGTRERESYEFQHCKERVTETDKPRPRVTQMLRTIQDILLQPRGDRILEERSAFRTAIEVYTLRSLTYEGDRLNAFRGIINSFSHEHASRTELHALSGFPARGRLLHPLFDWYIPGSSHRITHDVLNTRALPSWSWTGWSGAVRFDIKGTDKYNLVVMNENNIRLDGVVESSEWPIEPAPCTLTPKEGIVLHMWAPYLQCKLVETTSDDKIRQRLGISATHRFYSITMVSDGGPKAKATIVLDPAIVPSAGTDAFHEFIDIGWSDLDYLGRGGRRLMLVKRCDNPDFVERVGISLHEVGLNDLDFDCRHMKVL